MTHDRKPGYLKQWLDLQAKLIELIPHEISMTEPKLVRTDYPMELRKTLMWVTAGDPSVDKYLVIVTMLDNLNVYCEVMFSVDDSAVRMPTVWESCNVMKAKEAAAALELRRLTFVRAQAVINSA